MNNKQLINKEIEHCLTRFNVDFSTVEIMPLGNGHINSTYKLVTPEAEFVLQKINHQIFVNPVQLCDNAQQINQHLLAQKAAENYALMVPQILLTKQGQGVVKIGEHYWRLMEFVANSYTFETVANVQQAGQVAQAFAQFSCALSDFSADSLHVIIEDFHDISFRMQQLTQAVDNNSANRLLACQDLVDFCFAQQSFIDDVVEISKQLPLHVTHNDTKINNLLFSKTTNAPCGVIDLDTCMPGLLMHDFGDMVRTCCSNLPEDDSNIDEMAVNFDVFFALLTSYKQAFGNKMNMLEQQSLIVGAKLLPFIIGTRFLTDYLNGDNYFTTSRQQQNLDRAKNQLHLYQLISEAEQAGQLS